MTNQQKQIHFIEKMDEVKSIINGKYHVPMPTFLKISEIAVSDQITEIYSKADFNSFTESYLKTNQYFSASLTGDFFVDHPWLGFREVDDFVCITL